MTTLTCTFDYVAVDIPAGITIAAYRRGRRAARRRRRLLARLLRPSR